MTGDPILVARKVSKRFGGLIAVHAVDMSIPQGAIASLIGPNGAGKTTFFNVVAGIMNPTSGEIVFQGRRVVARPERTWIEPISWIPSFLIMFGGVVLLAANQAGGQPAVWGLVAVAGMGLLINQLLLAIARPEWYQRLQQRFGMFRSARPNDMVKAGVGRTFQNIRLFQNMTGLENVLVGMHVKLTETALDAVLATPRRAREEKAAAQRASDLLKLVGLAGREDVTARNLPYGDQRRLELARALACDPALLLLDEPTAGMNPHETQQMTRLISRLRTELGLTILLIEHDMRVVMGISDQVTVLDHGELIAEGPPEEIRRNPRVIEAYLGTSAA